MLKGYESFLIKNSKTNIQNKKKPHLALGSQLRIFDNPKLYYQAFDDVFSLTQNYFEIGQKLGFYYGISSKSSLSIQRKHYKSTSYYFTIFKMEEPN